MSGKSTVTATVGYMCWALTEWMLSMTHAAWFDTQYAHGIALMLPLSLILLIVGILAFTEARALDAIIFFGGAGLLGSGHVYLTAVAGAASASTDPGHYAGWYWFIWAVFFCYVWFGSFKAGWSRMVFLLALWLTLLALAIAAWSGATGFVVLGGYLGLITAILAAITSATAVICHGRAPVATA